MVRDKEEVWVATRFPSTLYDPVFDHSTKAVGGCGLALKKSEHLTHTMSARGEEGEDRRVVGKISDGGDEGGREAGRQAGHVPMLCKLVGVAARVCIVFPCMHGRSA